MENNLEEKIKEFVESQRKRSTVQLSICHINKFTKFLLTDKEELRPFHEIEPVELDNYLSEFFMNLKMSDGTDYEPVTIQSIKCAIERRLREEYYPATISESLEFNKTRQVLQAKMKYLKKQGLGRQKRASECITANDEDLLKEKKFLGIETPESLQFSVYYYFSKGFGLRGRDEHRQMKFGDVSVKNMNDGTKYLELKERKSKTMDGSKVNDHRQTRPKIFETDGSEMDPVKIFIEFTSRRPASAKSEESPMYLQPIQESKIKDEIWYHATPMGKNTLGNLVKKYCTEAGVSGRKTNHSLRKSCVRELSDAGVPPHKIIKITGHKSTSSLQHYDRELTNDEHLTMSNILINKNSNINVKTGPSIQAMNQTKNISQETKEIDLCGTTLSGPFNNCSFSFNITHK